MKVQDLMTGNLVCISKRKAKVVEIRKELVGVEFLDDNGFDVFKPDDLLPIELTAEMLVANGFENDYYEEETVADYVNVKYPGYSLRCKSEEWDDALVTWCNGHIDVVTDFHGEVRGEISFVHQLQHALRFCEIDKEIEVKEVEE